MKITEKFVGTMEEEIKRYQEWLDGAKQSLDAQQYFYLLPESLDKYEKYTHWSTVGITEAQLDFNIPWVPKICDHICLDLEDMGWKVSWDFKTDGTGQNPKYCRHYKHDDAPNLRIGITMDSGKDESTCKLIQVGTEMVEKPIWQVQCADEFSVEDL